MAAGGRRKSGRILILLALVLVLVLALAAFFLRDQLLPQSSVAEVLATPTPRQDLVNIVVIAQPVSRGTILTEAMLATIAYPQRELVAGLFFTNMEEVIGAQVKFDLEQGVPLTRSMITDAKEGSYAAFEIPRGMVAISIPIDELTSLSYGLQPRDHINIIGTIQLVDLDTDFQTRLPNYTASVISPGPTDCNECAGDSLSAIISTGGAGSTQGRTELDPVFQQPVYVIPSEDQRPRMVSQTIVQDAIVLWVGDFPETGQLTTAAAQPTPTPLPEGQAPVEGQVVEETPLPTRITLIVTPQDAVTLRYMLLSDADLALVLRGAGDTDRVATEAVTLQFIMDQYNFPYPAKLPYGLDNVISVTDLLAPAPLP
ncbi:MAG: Flp pilus assembly protein CpaB [Chloroflexi bacterium]|nr:Flp pilus assembly protein CpaB [Chloroflexota bacterium]